MQCYTPKPNQTNHTPLPSGFTPGSNRACKPPPATIIRNIIWWLFGKWEAHAHASALPCEQKELKEAHAQRNTAIEKQVAGRLLRCMLRPSRGEESEKGEPTAGLCKRKGESLLSIALPYSYVAWRGVVCWIRSGTRTRQGGEMRHGGWKNRI